MRINRFGDSPIRATSRPDPVRTDYHLVPCKRCGIRREVPTTRKRDLCLDCCWLESYERKLRYAPGELS